MFLFYLYLLNSFKFIITYEALYKCKITSKYLVLQKAFFYNKFWTPLKILKVSYFNKVKTKILKTSELCYFLNI